MTEGRLPTSGIAEEGVEGVEHDGRQALAPLSCPDNPSPQPSPARGEGAGCASVMPAGPPVMPAGPPVMPAGPPVMPAGPPVMPAGPPVMPAGPSVMPAGPPLSFPPVVSGNPVSCFFVPLFVWAGMGKDLDSRLKMSGMTERGLPTAGMAEGRLPMSGMTAGGLPTSGMTAGGLPMSGMAAGGLPTAGVTCVCQTRHRKFCRFAVISSCPRISAIIISVTRPGCNR